MNAEEPPLPQDLPPGRDWSPDLRIGVHANPSMNHLHIHILSRDMHSECVRHRTHYQSFTTEFFCQIDEMPLSPEEIENRRDGAHDALKERPMKCWRCGRGFESQFKKLKEHLEEEFVAWRRE
jgi:aprataxin